MIQVAAYDPVAPSALAEWQADVDRVVPPSETLSGLLLRYEDGDPWRPINRLFLWQTWPLENTPLDLLVALRGPHPRSTGHYCGGKGWCPEGVEGEPICRIPRYRWVGGPSSARGISRQQYEIFRAIGRYADPYWVIQGDRGGHRKVLFDWEKEALELATEGRVRNVPEAGTLDYAPYDRRVREQLAAGDLLRQWEQRHFRAFTARTGGDVERYEADRRRALGPAWGAWLRSQVEEMFDEGKSGWRALANEYRAGASEERLIRREKEEMYDAKWAALVSGDPD